MPDMIRGQRVKIADLTPSLHLELGVRVAGPAHEYDVSVFGLDPAGKLSDDRYMVFYNQKDSPEGAVTMLPNSGLPNTGGETRFAVDLARLPKTIEKLMLTASVDITDAGGAFSQISSGHLALYAGGNELARFPFYGADFGNERAIIVAELYLKDVWRLSAVGQGFAGGLDALVAAYSGEVKASAPVAQPVTQPVQPAPAPVNTSPVNTQRPSAPPPTVNPAPMNPAPINTSPVNTQRPSSASATPPSPAAPASPIRLTKVTLEKQGQRASISLIKDGGQQPIHVNLNWDKGGGKRKGLFGLPMSVPDADLDLGCLFVMKDGEMGAIQALGNRFGSERFAPYILLDKDDRSGVSSDGENLYILRPELIQQVLVFAFIYEGTSDFTSVNGRLNIKDAGGNEIAIRLNNPDARRTFCAIAMFENVGGKIEVSKEERYFHGHQDCDEHYGFGFQWRAGSK